MNSQDGISRSSSRINVGGLEGVSTSQSGVESLKGEVKEVQAKEFNEPTNVEKKPKQESSTSPDIPDFLSGAPEGSSKSPSLLAFKSGVNQFQGQEAPKQSEEAPIKQRRAKGPVDLNPPSKNESQEVPNHIEEAKPKEAKGPIDLNPSLKNESKEAKKEMAKQSLASIEKFRITATGLLPFSSRSMPAHLVKSFGAGLSASIRDQSITPFRSTFKETMKTQMKKNGGISDSYTKLTSPENREMGKKIAQDNMRYAGYMYGDQLESKGELRTKAELASEGPKFEDVQWKGKAITNNMTENQQKFSQVLENVRNMGFKEDINGKFFDPKTGTIFSLVFDQKNEEIVLCFEGLGQEASLQASDEVKSQMGWSSLGSAAGEFFGGISDQSIQAIALGKMIKDEAGKLNLKPVMVGHSHGGALAQAASLANDGIKCVVFNSQPMGAGVRRFIGQDVVAKNADNITVFAGKGDFLSRTKGLNVVATWAEKIIGIPLPRTVGKGYDLPPSEHDQGELLHQHNNFFYQLRNVLQKEETENA
jgi:hypothetical protein